MEKGLETRMRADTIPPLVIPGQDLLYLNGAEDIFSGHTIGKDGVAFTLPANSKVIIKTGDGL